MATAQQPTAGPRRVLSARTLHHVKGPHGEFVASFTNKADALLDAAAPDLIQAMKAILKHPDVAALRENENTSNSLCVAFALGLAAINKAEPAVRA